MSAQSSPLPFSALRRHPWVSVLAAAVLLGSVGLAWFGASAAPGQVTISVLPPVQTVQLTDPIAVDVVIDTAGQAIAAVEVSGTFSNLLLIGYDASTSVFAEEIKPVAVSGNTFDTVRLTLSAGYNGSAGQIVRLYFQALAPGSANIGLDLQQSQAIAFANSSNVLAAVRTANVTVAQPPAPSSSSSSSSAAPSSSSAAASSIGSSQPASSPPSSAAASSTPSSAPLSSSSSYSSSVLSSSPSSSAASSADASISSSLSASSAAAVVITTAPAPSTQATNTAPSGGAAATTSGRQGGSSFTAAPLRPLILLAPNVKPPVVAPAKAFANKSCKATGAETQSALRSGRLTLIRGGKTTEFVDVPDAWFTSAVAELLRLGIVSGYRDRTGRDTGYFGPADRVTLEQSAKMITRITGSEGIALKPKNPSSQGELALYVAWAEYQNWPVLGDGSNPDVHRTATREEVAGMIARALNLTQSSVAASPFADVPSNSRFLPAIAVLNTLGILKGDGGAKGTPRFRPADAVSRAEMATVISRVKAYVCGE